METIILASGSRRRQDYFRLLGLPFMAIPSIEDEIIENGLGAREAAEHLAIQKAKSVRRHSWVVGADTLISLDNALLGKSKNRAEARAMLQSLQNRSHNVITAIVLLHAGKGVFDCRSVVSSVTFAAMKDAEIEWYLDSGEWEGAAGAYQIQGKAACFITEIKGSFSSIVGLPLRELYCMLRENGYPYGTN